MEYSQTFTENRINIILFLLHFICFNKIFARMLTFIEKNQNLLMSADI